MAARQLRRATTKRSIPATATAAATGIVIMATTSSVGMQGARVVNRATNVAGMTQYPRGATLLLMPLPPTTTIVVTTADHATDNKKSKQPQAAQLAQNKTSSLRVTVPSSGQREPSPVPQTTSAAMHSAAAPRGVARVTGLRLRLHHLPHRGCCRTDSKRAWLSAAATGMKEACMQAHLNPLGATLPKLQTEATATTKLTTTPTTVSAAFQTVRPWKCWISPNSTTCKILSCRIGWPG
mmetsp:Transcript_80857/g.168761  ORF Transcript_80857/g.168761 Transcript_80857/m.168761 type:complete len:238 (+) Transcript_80857:983-1696(+)